MSSITRKLSWPLLGKELVEQAARKRTYIVRMIYAALLFGVFLFLLNSFYKNYAGQYHLGVLGMGKTLFDGLLICLCAAILIFLPAMMAGVITSEKERGSLELLFLTDLTPREIIRQKYLGRLIPMVTFLLASLPLFAVAYAFGGLSTEVFAAGIAMLFLTCLHLGALSLLCSAYCRTTVGAIMASYIVGVLCYAALPYLIVAFNPSIDGEKAQWMMILSPPMEYLVYTRGSSTMSEFVACVVVFVILLTSWIFLKLAEIYLMRRAFMRTRNGLLASFKRLDAFFRVQNKLVGGIEFFSKPDALPDDDPVAWRELEKRSLGKANYLIRIFLAIEIPIGILCLISLAWHPGRDSDLMEMFTGILWVIGALVLIVQSVNIIARERTSQTLEPLLTTPLTGREIVQQKMRGVQRMALVFAIPLLTMAIAEYWCRTNYRNDRSGSYLITSLCAVAIYLPMLCWIGLWISMKCKTKYQSILIVLGVIVAWCVGPLLVFMMTVTHFGRRIDDPPFPLILLLSPASGIYLTETTGWRESTFGFDSFISMVFNFSFYAIILYCARAACLRRADLYLRGETKSVK